MIKRRSKKNITSYRSQVISSMCVNRRFKRNMCRNIELLPPSNNEKIATNNSTSRMQNNNSHKSASRRKIGSRGSGKISAKKLQKVKSINKNRNITATKLF